MKIKNFFSKLSFAFALIGTLCGVMFLSNNKAISKTEGAYTVYNQIQNNLPQYLSFENSSSSITTDKSIILMDHEGNLSLSIAADTNHIVNGNGENTGKSNYAYYPDINNKNMYYYFDFISALSLYKDITNQEITEGLENQNLLDGKNIETFAQPHDTPFAIQGYSFTPKKFNITFNLGSQFNSGEQEIITLTEGLYTLVIPIKVYYTYDNGLTFSLLTTTQIEYTFMLFNSGTYFNTSTGMQNVTMSNAEQVSITNSSVYSAYYYYNYTTNQLPKFTYNPYVYQISVTYTDYEQLTHYAKIEFNGTDFNFLDENGQPSSENFVMANYDENLKQVYLTFNELGRYDLSFEYLYMVENGDNSQIFLLPFDALTQGVNSNIKNLSQRLYVYGYQATYTNHNAPVDPSTNQHTSAELKTISDDELSFDTTLTADITASFESKLSNHSSTPFDFKNAALITDLETYINDKTPVVTNQTPVKFLFNVNFDSGSYFYKVVSDSDGNKKLKKEEAKPFTNENQDEAGEYLYVVQYTFNDYMGAGGIQQSGYYHYQLFYFKITNEVPSISVIEKNGENSSLKLTGFTSKSVYIVNESTKSPYNANVSIQIKVYDYVRGTTVTFNSLKEMTQYDSSSFIYYENFNLDGSELNGKEILEINAENPNTNRRYTIEYKNTNEGTPQSKKFTIDTNEIVFLSAKTIDSEIGDNQYSLGKAIESISTNSPFVFRWQSKSSGAMTYGYVKQFPLEQINYYNQEKLGQTNYQTLLSDILSTEIIPVSYKINFLSDFSSTWSQITNTTTDIASGINIKSTNGLYVLQVFDDAGNYGFYTMLYDDTQPVFLKNQENSYGSTYSILNSYDIIPAVEDDISIHWGNYKAIILQNYENLSSIESVNHNIAYTIDKEKANYDLQKLLTNYTNLGNENITQFNTINSNIDGLPYNSRYLLINIDERYLVRNTNEQYDYLNGNSYKITTINEATTTANEGTYQIYITDASNANGNKNILNSPSAKLSLTVTSDSSQTFIKYLNDNNEWEPLKTAGYSLSNIFYENSDGQLVKDSTTVKENENGETIIENKPREDKTYKYMYYTPTTAKRILYVTYIPLSSSGTNKSTISTLTVEYYPYEIKKVEKTNFYYYDVVSSPENIITIFDYSKASGLVENQQEEFQLALGSDDYPLNGRYVIKRTYTEDSTASQYDFYERTLTIDIDSSNLISQLEQPSSDSAWESIIGGDIVLSMYSGENQSTIQVSFPFDKEGNQNNDSFYNGEYTNDMTGTTIEVASVSGNKLPMMLYVPKYKYTKNANYNKDDNSFSVTENNNLSYYGNAHIKRNEETGTYEVVVEGLSVYGPTTLSDAQQYLYNNLSIKQYEIYATIEYTPVGSKDPTIFYKTNGTTSDGGYLNFYSVNSLDNEDSTSLETPINALYKAGKYVVTLYQASKDGDDFYRFYKFRFDITSQEPTIDVIDQNTGLILENKNNSYYTNSSSLSLEWEVPLSEYLAKIDEDNINITYYPDANENVTEKVDFEIVNKGSTTTLDRKILLNLKDKVTTKNSKLHVTMQYEGFDSTYYNILSIDIYFDVLAPTANLNYLMNNLTNSINNYITPQYWAMNTRENYSYNNVQTSSLTDFAYSYTLNTGIFKGYAYTVDKSFVDKLTSTVQNASVNKYETQKIYYKHISTTDGYITSFTSPTTKENFIASSFNEITGQSVRFSPSNVYEIVEIDSAGNMTSYLINYVGDLNQTSEAEEFGNIVALNYTNKNEDNENIQKQYNVYNNQISNGSNIYSNTGFSISGLNYQNNPWGFYKIQLNGSSGYTYYMTSPALNSNEVYKLTKPTSSEITFNNFPMSQILNQDIQSSSLKHSITFNNVLNGTTVKNYITIMDASLETQTIKNNQNKNSAILDISIPTASQIQSTTNGYIYPKKIEIQEFINNEWITYTKAIQTESNYGVWNFEMNNDTIQFTSSTATLRITVNVAENTKVKYIIEDNFGNTTTIIQIANEIEFNEVSGTNYVYEIPESGNETTYLADSSLTYSYNSQLYRVKVSILKTGGFEEATNADYTENDKLYGHNINTLYFTSMGDNYDKVFKVELFELENNQDVLKTIYVKLYNKLPKYNATGNTNSIKMIDKNGNTLLSNNPIKNQTVHINGTTIITDAQPFTTYSQNVTLSFTNGQFNSNSDYFYNSNLSYSVYISRNGGETWENINQNYEGYLISGTGNYQILVKYDSESYFTSICNLYYLTIVDSSSVYYYITVDDSTVEKSKVVYTNDDNKTFESTYIVSVNYNDKDIRFNIAWNEDEELNLNASKPIAYPVGDGVWVEEYSYYSKTSSGSFAVIFIPEEDDFVTTLNYEDSIGSSTEITENSITVYSSKIQSNFEKLKINFKAYYGIETNKVNIEIQKYFNGAYTPIDCTIYKGSNSSTNYFYLEKSGSYRIIFKDSCSPANVQRFGNNDYLSVIFLNEVPFIISYQEGEEIITSERVQKAVYNSPVTISLYNLSTYFKVSGYPVISVKKDGVAYNVSSSNYTYRFTEPGYYSVKFSATTLSNIEIREVEYNFTIINANESKYAYSFSNYKDYYIKKVVKDGIDITQNIINISNFDTMIINNVEYLTELALSYGDEKTGAGRYTITISSNQENYTNILSNDFTFDVWINSAVPPINVSIAEGESTSNTITVTVNMKNFYESIGDSYLIIGKNRYNINADTIASYQEIQSFALNDVGTWYIQVYSDSGNLLYSYKVYKTAPLNAFSIIAIIIGVIVLLIIIIITIKLRKRQRAK